MNENTEKVYRDKLKKLLNRYILKSRQFCDKYCHSDGLTDILICIVEYGNISKIYYITIKLSDDFDYYIYWEH